jgi:hypothetical protein
MTQKCGVVVIVLLLPLIPACEAGRAPGAPLTDVTATNIENTGPFDVFERTTEDDVLRVKVRAAVPEAAELIAEHVLYQVRHTASRGVVVEVYPADHEGAGAPLARLEWVRPAGSQAPASRPSAHVPSSADRVGAPGQRP